MMNQRISSSHPQKSLSDAISISDEVVERCDEIIEWLDAKYWHRSAVVSHGVSQDRTSSTSVVPLLSFHNPPFIHEMNRRVWECIHQHAATWDFSFASMEEVSVQRYEPGEFYVRHIDAGTGASTRVVSAVAYLNTVDEGGETSFPYAGVSVKPIQGRVVVFPSNYVFAHEALPPISGTKYAATYWAHL